MHSPVSFTVCVAGICSLWLLWDQGIKPFFLDLFRERVFELRFALFQLGRSGEVPFDCDLYRTLELLLCGLLRFAHRVTLLTFVSSLIEQDRARKTKNYVDLSQQIALKMSRLENRTQVKVSSILDGVRRAILLYIAFTSLFLLAAATVLYIAKRFRFWRPEEAKNVTGVVEQEAYRAESGRSLTLVPA